MTSLYFELDMFCLFEARVLRIGDATSSTEALRQLCKCTLHTILQLFELAEYIQPSVMLFALTKFCRLPIAYPHTGLVLL